MVDKDKAVWCEHPYCTREHYEGHGLCSFEMDNAELCTDPTCNAARAGIPHAASSPHTRPYSSMANTLRRERDEADRKAAVCFLVAAAIVAAGILVVFVLQIVGV